MKSQRLTTVAHMVSEGNKVADIGCDHGYTSIYLMEQKIASKVIAMDINQGPLERAKEHIYQSPFRDSIDIRLSDGMDKLCEGEADTLLISGMGGLLIMKILKEGSSLLSQVKELVLQPQSEQGLVRHFLHDTGFQIIKEAMVYEEGKYYTIIKAVHGKQQYEEEYEYLYGRELFRGKDPVLMQYLSMLENKYQNLCEKVQEPVRRGELLEELTFVRRGLAQIGGV